MTPAIHPLLLASIPPLLWGIETFFLTKANRSMDAFRAQFIFQLIGIPLFLVILPFLSPEKNSNIPLIIGLGIWETFAFTLYFYALRIGQMAIIGTILESYVIITIFLAVIFLHESLYLLKIIAVFAVIVGVALLGFHLQDIKKNKRMKLFVGVFPALVAAFMTGIYFFFVGVSSRVNGWYSTALGIRIMIPITILVLFIMQRKKIQSLFTDIAWKWIIPGVFLDVAAFSVFNIAVSHYEVSYVSIIGTAAPVVSTVLAIVFLREKLTIFQFIGFLFVIAGIVCLNIA